MDELINKYFEGDRRALARLISIVENDENHVEQLISQIFPKTGMAFRIGITGPPGAGKSTIVDQLTKRFRKEDRKVGIIAVDPTSPFTGGALLGDRIRMSDLANDPGVFIRSMATRGSLGGLSLCAQEVADLMDGFGMDVIIFETVGVGQSELDIVEAADSTVVVLVPESGDSIQAMKAGLMEIADIFVINKADREGAERTALEIKHIMEMRDKKDSWRAPIIQTVASLDKGIGELKSHLQEHFFYQKEHHVRIRKLRNRIEKYIRKTIENKVIADFWHAQKDFCLADEIESVIQNKKTPYEVSLLLLNEIKVVNN